MTETWIVGKHTQMERIWVSFPFDPDTAEALKLGVPGLRWDADGKVWHAPMDMGSARDIATVARQRGAKLSVRAEVAAWAKAEKARVAGLPAVTDVTRNDSLLQNVRQTHPNLIAAMNNKPWQLPGAQFIASQRRVIVADEPGLGKTLQCMAALMEANVTGPILVVAPKSAVDITWPEEIVQWLGPNEMVFRISADMTPAQRRHLVERAGYLAVQRSWVLIGPSYLRIKADVDDYGNFARDEKGRKIVRVVNHAIPELFSFTWAAVIVDESHETLAGQSPGVGKKKWSSQRLGLDALKIDPNGFRIAISGTPFRGKTENMFGTLNWLAPDKYTSFWNWVKRHYGVNSGPSAFGSGIIKGDTLIDERRFYSELRPYMIRRTYAEVAKDMPPKTYGGTRLDPTDDKSPIAVWLPLTKSQRRQYDKVVSEALLYLGGEEWTVNGALAEMVRLKQVANSCLKAGNDKPEATAPSNKVDFLLDFLRERQESGIKVIVASQFTTFLNMLSSELNKAKVDHYLLTGATSSKRRVSQKKSFQSDDGYGVFLLNTKAGGVSLTLDAADDVVICDQTWIPDDQQQIENRAYRISRYHHVNIWYLASLDTIDEDIAVLNAQREHQTSVIDRQRGVSLVKALVAATKKRKKVA